MNNLGYQLLREKKVAEVIVVFKRNVEPPRPPMYMTGGFDETDAREGLAWESWRSGSRRQWR
jgi:hypothetical protein